MMEESNSVQSQGQLKRFLHQINSFRPRTSHILNSFESEIQKALFHFRGKLKSIMRTPMK